MYIILYVVLLLIIIIFGMLIVCKNTNENGENEENYEIIKYKIEHKQLDLSDKFNIKEYDVINDNIIIHNKFKNELIDSKRNKECNIKKLNNEKERENEKMDKLIKKNAKHLKYYELKKQYKTLSNEISSLKNTFKLDLTNFLNDNKQNNISKDVIKLIIKKLNIEIDNNLNKIKKIQLNYSDIDDIDLLNKYEDLLLIKDDILNKKKNIYIKFI